MSIMYYSFITLHYYNIYSYKYIEVYLIQIIMCTSFLKTPNLIIIYKYY